MKLTLYVSIRGGGMFGKEIEMDFIPPVGTDMWLVEVPSLGASLGAGICSKVCQLECFLFAERLRDGKPDMVVHLEEIERDPDNPAEAGEKWELWVVEIAKALEKEGWTNWG